MADDSGPTEVPHDEPTAAFGPVPDEPTVALNITQMTPDEPATGATGPIDIVPAPEPPRPDRPKQLTIGLAVVAAIVLIVAVVVVSTDGDGAGMSTGTTPFTTSAASTSAVSPASMATASTTVVEPHTSTQPIDPDMPTTVAAPTPFFTASASDFAFNHDGTRIATSSEGGPTTIWDLPSGAARVTLEGGDSNLAFTEDDEVLMAAPWVEPSWGYAQMWSLVDGHHVAGDVLTRDGKFQIRDTDSGGLTLVDVHTGEAVSTFALPGEGIGPRHGSPDGHTYAIQGAATFEVFLVDLLAGQILSRIDPPAGCLIGVNGFSDDGRLIVANGNARAGRS